MRKIQEYFIGRLLLHASDPLEQVKIKLSYRFLVIYLLTTLVSFPVSLLFQRYDIFALMVGLFALNSGALLALKQKGSYRIAAILIAVSSIASAVGNSILASLNLSIILFLWPVMIAVFLSFTLGKKANLIYITIFALSIIVISIIKIQGIFPENSLDDLRIYYSTGGMIVLASAFLYYFLSIYEDSRNEAIAAQLESVEARDNVLHIVAHDLRNTVGANKGCVELLERAIADGDVAERKELMELLAQNAEESMGIVNDLLESASAQNSSLRLHLEKVNLHELLHNLVEQYKPAASNKNIVLSFSSTTSFIQVSLDPEKMKRAIGNLITNGLKFTHPGGIVQVEMTVQDDLVQLRVMDNGIGIPPEMLEKLFLKYSKAGRKGTRGERTTGLGMYITKNILESHRASIQVRSKVNKGTEFEIQIPRNVSLA